ncbi:MAG: hypothetical protein WBV23_04070 [Desulfobaccales bacterium]
MRKFISVFFYSFYLLLAIFVCLEILVRGWGYAGMYFYDPIYMPYKKIPEIPYVMQPNLTQVRAQGNIWIHTDALGLRSPVSARTYGNKPADEYRIAFVGNAVTFGVGVPTGATYPEIVEKSLNELQDHCRVAVFNFAIPSYSVKEMTATVKHRVPEIDPDLVVMGIMIGDFDPDHTPQVDKWEYNTHTGASQVINRFPTIKLILRKIHLSYVIRDTLSRIIVEHDKDDESLNEKLTLKVAGSYKYIREVKSIAQEYGYSYLVLTLPSGESPGSKYIGLINNLINDSINYFDTSTITPLFTVKEYHASKYDWHPSALVHQKIGEMLSQQVLNNFIGKTPRK